MVIIKRVGVWSLAKLQALLMAIVGLFIGIIYAIVGLLFGSLVSGMEGAQGIGMIGVGLGFFAIIAMPILYGLIGLVSGAFGAWIYNLIAGWIGGVEVEFVEKGRIR